MPMNPDRLDNRVARCETSRRQQHLQRLSARLGRLLDRARLDPCPERVRLAVNGKTAAGPVDGQKARRTNQPERRLVARPGPVLGSTAQLRPYRVERDVADHLVEMAIPGEVLGAVASLKQMSDPAVRPVGR